MSALGDTVGDTLAVMSCGYARTGVRRSGATARAAEQGVGITEGQCGGVGGGCSCTVGAESADRGASVTANCNTSC